MRALGVSVLAAAIAVGTTGACAAFGASDEAAASDADGAAGGPDGSNGATEGGAGADGGASAGDGAPSSAPDGGFGESLPSSSRLLFCDDFDEPDRTSLAQVTGWATDSFAHSGSVDGAHFVSPAHAALFDGVDADGDAKRADAHVAVPFPATATRVVVHAQLYLSTDETEVESLSIDIGDCYIAYEGQPGRLILNCYDGSGNGYQPVADSDDTAGLVVDGWNEISVAMALVDDEHVEAQATKGTGPTAVTITLPATSTPSLHGGNAAVTLGNGGLDSRAKQWFDNVWVEVE